MSSLLAYGASVNPGDKLTVAPSGATTKSFWSSIAALTEIPSLATGHPDPLIRCA